MITLKKPYILWAVFLFFAPLPMSAQVEIELHGAVETLFAQPFSKAPGQDLGPTDSRAAFTGELQVFAGQAMAFVSLSAEYNNVSPDRTGFSLGEAWIDWGAGGFSLRLGRQLLSWGVADGLILTDVVCPQNLTAYAGLDFAGSRLPVDGLRLGYSFSAFSVEALWLPLFTPAKLPEDARNPLHGIFYPSSVAVGGMVLPVFVGDPGIPQTIGGGEYGLRVSAYAQALDFSFSAFYGWNDIPYINKTLIPSPSAPFIPAGLELMPEYGRTFTLGADASIPLGEILLRLETAWTGGGRFDRGAEEAGTVLSGGQRDEPLKKHNLKALAGIDWNPSGWNFSVQYYEDLLPDAYNGGTSRPWRKNGLSLRAAKGLFRETVNLSLWCYLDLLDFDTAGSFSGDYALTDSLKISGGTDFFTGGIDDRGSYSAYKYLSAVWIKGIFRF